MKYECWIKGCWEIEATSDEDAKEQMQEMVRSGELDECIEVNCLERTDG